MNNIPVMVPVVKVVAGRNDRTTFEVTALEELASSIREHGLLQPPTMRPVCICDSCNRVSACEQVQCTACGGDVFHEGYEIVAGERRTRAVRDVLGWDKIPAFVRHIDDERAAALMLSENVARRDLDPMDEARAYQTRMDVYGWSAKDTAKQAGVSERRVTNMVKLLSLRSEIQKLVRDRQFQVGYAQVLADADLDTNRQMLAVRRFQESASPTVPWFRRLCAELLAQQQQEPMFDFSLLTVVVGENGGREKFKEPASPGKSVPPVVGSSPQDIIRGQRDYWLQASLEWDALGKVFKKQECEAAAAVLTGVLEQLQAVSGLSIEDAALVLGCSVSTVRYHYDQGNLKGRLQDGRLVFDRLEVERLQVNRRSAGRPKKG